MYAHVERAVADQDGRVRLEGDIAAVRRVANALQVGTAGETHYLFGDDRFGPWGAEFERAAARAGLQPQDTVTVGQIRGWIDAIRPELGLRDEVADLVILAWAALRQRAWYQHGGSIATPRPGGARPDMELRPEPLPAPGDWQAATSRAESLFGIRVNPYLTAAGLTELTGSIRSKVDTLADAAAVLVPRIEDAYRHAELAESTGGRLATARAAAVLVQALQRAGSRVHLVETLARADLPTTEPAMASSLRQAAPVSRALHSFRWDRLAPLRRAESATDQRGRAAAGILQDLREALTADEFATRLRTGPVEDRRRHLRMAGEWPAEACGRSPRPCSAPMTSSPAARLAIGLARRHGPQGAPASDVLEPLREFLEANRDKRVVVEWRVQGVTGTATRATLPVLRALLEQARAKDYRSGVLGVRARPGVDRGAGIQARGRARAGRSMCVGARRA